MILAQLIDALADARLIGDGGVQVRAVQDDSRNVVPGDVFVAVRGLHSDGHAFVQTAIERGAVAIVVDHEVSCSVATVVVPSTSVALGLLVARSLGDPANAMTLIGVTGTNGKTTTTYLVEAILRAAGAKPGVIGTVEMRYGDKVLPVSYTTPTPQILHAALAEMRAAGCTHVVMEVTSSALAMERVVGLRFGVAAFSNLTQDHLDVHGSMAAYRDAKRRLFAELMAPDGTAAVNVDDPEGAGMGAAAPHVLSVSAHAEAAVRVVAAESTVRGIRMTLATPRGELAIVSHPLIGAYNVANLALAVGIAEALGLPHEAIARGLADTAPPGRVERVANSADLDIFVDYAHTPDALRNVLAALRPLTKRRLICVFGCGGDRDPTKRPKMGHEVAELADLAIVTSDNPRTEDPRAIIDMILPAVPKPYFVDPDRRVAIRAAIAEATPGDVVVIAGKGHEDYQILGTQKIHFDDREEAAAAVLARESRTIHELARDCDGKALGNAQIDRVTIDSRHAAPGALYVAIRGDTHDGHRFIADAIQSGAVAAMVSSPTTEIPAIVVGDTRLGIGALAREHRKRWPGKLVAITGSAGKTTTKELVRSALAMAGTTHAAEGSLNNETGVPLTLLALRRFHQYGVVEMGMRGKGQIEYLTRIAEPDVAVVVNAGTAHIELLGSTDAIAAAKSEIWLGLRPGGVVVRPADDPRLERWARDYQPRALHLTFGETVDADIRLSAYAPTDAGGRATIDIFGSSRELQLGLVGKHAALDACAALAAVLGVAIASDPDWVATHSNAVAAGLAALFAVDAVVDRALAGLARARPPAMRGEIVAVAGRRMIVDCYNANPASMAAALRTLAERAHDGSAIAVLGDMLELGDHAPAAHRDAGELAKQLGLHVIALGDFAAAVADASGGEVASSPADAAARALARTKPGGWILLKASRGMRLERVLDAMKELAP